MFRAKCALSRALTTLGLEIRVDMEGFSTCLELWYFELFFYIIDISANKETTSVPLIVVSPPSAGARGLAK